MIMDQGRVLLAQRPAHKHLGLKWEFPGGKIEPNETAAAALRREIREELGCAIEIECALPPFRHDYGAVVIEMFPFVCRLADARKRPQPTEHVALAWPTPGELGRFDLAPADIPLIAQLASRPGAAEPMR
jgi:8-oxo-dGTP diphosphatase